MDARAGAAGRLDAGMGVGAHRVTPVVQRLTRTRRSWQRSPKAARAGTTLVGDVANSVETIAPLSDSALSAVVFRELIGFRVDEPLPMIAQAERESASIPRAARVARGGRAARAVLGVPPLLLRRAAARSGRCRSIWASRGPRSSSSGPAAGRGAGCSRLWARGRPPGSRRSAGPIDYLERLGLLERTPAGGPRRAADERGAAPARRCRGNHRDLPAQQRVDRGRYTADGSVLFVRRPGSDRDRQPGERGHAERVRRDGCRAPSRAIRARSAGFSRPPRSTGPRLSASTTSARSSPGRRAELLAVQLPHTLSTAADVEQYLVSGVATRR